MYKYNFVNEGGINRNVGPLNEETTQLTLKVPCSDLYFDSNSNTVNPQIYADSLKKKPQTLLFLRLNNMKERKPFFCGR